MIMRIVTLTLICLIPLGAAVADTITAKIHPDVQKALTYQLPVSTCTLPIMRMTAADDTRILRYEKSYRRWIRCAKKYQSNLIEDFNRIEAVASHGLTEKQADILMGHLKSISAANKSMKSENVRLYEPLRPLSDEQKDSIAPY